MSTKHVATALRLALLGGAAMALVGCESIREAAGVVKTPPDEFAVVTKAPLVIPPDYNLRPPKPGAPPTNQSSPTDSAEAALTGDDPAAVAASLPNTYSPGEKMLLADTGGATADHNVRTQIAADAKAMSTASDSFTDTLLFRSPPDPNAGHPLDADAEHNKLVAERTDGQTPIEGQPAPKKDLQEGATIDKDGNKDADAKAHADDGWFSGGWFDGIF
ncbi:MAG TPA: DUF3035 domain-containing protein [Rhizomicrobium sp.]|nr:DUF3035 domain-containing protein [Rhizomicrobium sp.]